jgi:mycothiol synthase
MFYLSSELLGDMENSTINPAPPLLAGLIWRAITGDDLAALVELAAACHLADGGLACMNEPGNLKSRYFPDAPGASIGAFAADERLVARATVHLARKSDTERAIIVGQLRPKLRNRGIGTYLMRWSQAQAQALFTATTVDKRLLQVATESLTEPASRLYHAHGFEPVHEDLVMRRDLRVPLPVRPLPLDVTITSWQPALANQFFQAYEASFRERPGFPGLSAAEWIFGRTDDDNFKPGWSLLARAGEAPVGFLTAGSEHPGGFVVQIGVIPGQRRRGLGSALMVETMRRMRAAGETATQLTVNVNNPGAIQSYVQLGFAAVGRRARYEQIAL